MQRTVFSVDRPRRGMSLTCLLVSAFVLLAESAPAQDRASFLRRLDDNNNGYLDPDEIDGRVRNYLERFEGIAGIELDERHSLRRWEYAVRRYYENRNDDRDRERIDPDAGAGIRGFGPDPDAPLIPVFGLPEVKYPYTQEDLEQADSTLRRSDRNRDGYLDVREAEDGRWSRTDPFESDYNNDNRLSRLELAQRYAGRRIREEAPSTPSYSSRSYDDDDEDDEEYENRRFGDRSRRSDRGSRYLAYSVMERYDLNKNNELEPRELFGAGIEPGNADFDRNGLVDRDELSEYLFQEMDGKANDLAESLPVWFFERDLNGDRQVEMVEFTDQWDAAKAEEFASYDANQDGLVTAEELLKSKAIVGGEFSSSRAEYLLPRTTVVSEIEVTEDFYVSDLDVQISITHTRVDQLDGYLTSPDGQRVELFTGVGDNDDHFDNTVFDDQADDDITRARPPFRGRFRPEAVRKRDKSLSSFEGTNIKGVWQLMIRGSRSDRAGILHGWSLMVKPLDEFAERPDPEADDEDEEDD